MFYNNILIHPLNPHTLQQANLLHAQLTADGDIQILQQAIFPPLAVAAECQPPFKTAGQQTAVAAIVKVVTCHRRRPLVLTADRGFGMSAALGLAAELTSATPGQGGVEGRISLRGGRA